MTVSTPNEVPSPMRGSDFRGVEARDWGCACDACRATLYMSPLLRACVCAYRTMDRLEMTIEAV